MKRRIVTLLLGLTMLLGVCTPVWAAEEEEAPRTVAVAIDGAPVETFEAVPYGWTNYVPYTPATMALCPEAELTWEEGLFVARAEGLEMTARIGDRYLVVNGRYLYVEDGVKADEEGNALVPIRVLATALGVQVEWTGQVELTTGGAPLSEEDRPYTDEELDLVARVIHHESGYQPFKGKMAVGNVILNRVNSGSFPNSIYEVIYQKNQFPGATNATPNADSILAARLVLEGANVVPNAYWFNGVGKSCWASRNKSLVAVIGDHAFYG